MVNDMKNFSKNIDELDKKIIELLQEDPEITSKEISKIVKKSEPVVGARITKLIQNNLSNSQRGMNIRNIEPHMVKCEIEAQNPTKLMHKLQYCPFVMQAFKQSGKKNVRVLFLGDEYHDLDEMINTCYRLDDNITDMDLNYVIYSAKDMVVPVNFQIATFENHFGCANRHNCLTDDSEKLKLKELVRSTRKVAQPVQTSLSE